MASRALSYVLLLLCLYKDIIVAGMTTAYFYSDVSCTALYATVQTDIDAHDGQCGVFATRINSASAKYINDGCSVTAYTGSNATAWCNEHAILIPVGICTPMSIESYSVDCPGINGTYDPGYTTILASNQSSPVTTSTPTYNTIAVSSSASQPSSSPSNSTTSSQGRGGSGNDGGLSGPSTIAIGVVLPGVAVIVAIVFGVLGVKKYRREGRVLPRRRWSL